MRFIVSMLSAVLVIAVGAPISPAWSQAVKTADWQVKTEQAKALYMEGDFEGSRDLLLEVTAAQPDNGVAFRYLGLCWMRLGDPAPALAALERASDLLAESEVSQDAAWAAIAARDFVKAEQFADRALALDPTNEAAALYKAQARIGQRRNEEALPILEPLLASADFGQAAYYYTGICYTYMGQTEQALGYFEKAVALDPASDLGKEAALYVASLQTGEMPADEEQAPPYFVRLRVLYQFDTNVVPIFNEDYLPEEVSNMEDGRLMADLDARYDLYQSGNFTLTPRLYAYQSMQQIEHYYDLRFLSLGLHAGYQMPNLLGDRPGRLGLGLFYSNAFHHEEFYTESVRLSPEVVLPLGPGSNLSMVCDIMYENYAMPFDPDFNQDAWRYHFSISANQALLDGKVNTWLGYRWGSVQAQGDFYNRIDNAGVWGLIGTLPLDIQLTALVNYEIRDYPDSFFGRFERRTTASLALAIPLYENYDLYVGALHTDIDANVEVMSYRRWIYTVGVQATFPK